VKTKLIKIALFGFVITLLTACHKEEIIEDNNIVSDTEEKESLPPDWRDETHSDMVPPNFDKVFDQTRINRIDLVFTASEFNAMQSNFSTLVSNNQTDLTPDYIRCDFFFNGLQWYDVGVRYKANSKSFASFSAGNGKLPFKLDFDEFEDTNEMINDQRFFGFKQLSLHPNFNDNSLVREKLALDLYREFGVPASSTAFYEVYVDKGDGNPVYFGLYTMVEDLVDTLLEKQFSSNTGNSYEALGAGSKFSSELFDLNDFIAKTNLETSLKEEIQEFYDILHSSSRATDPTLWRQYLEAVFDVDGFLKYLAVNNSIQNWDTYGNKRGNYYLYQDPADNLLKWIVRGGSEALKSVGEEPPVSLSMVEVPEDWPLIHYLMSIPEYEADYKVHLENFANTIFTASSMDQWYNTYQQAIAPSVAKESSNYTHIDGGISAFESEYVILKAHTYQRQNAIQNYLE
jgi:hypothetical protein